MIFDQYRRDDFAGISIIQILVMEDKKADDGFMPSIAYLKERQAELAKKGVVLQVFPWKISDKEVFAKLLNAGIRFFDTDYPQEILASYKEIVINELPENLKNKNLNTRVKESFKNTKNTMDDCFSFKFNFICS